MESNGAYHSRRVTFRAFLREQFYGFFSEYETPKIVTIHSYTMTTLLRLMQIILLIYSIIYLLLYEKGYQKLDTAVISSITLKVKGIGYIGASKADSTTIDGADYIIPPSENNALFIMTNFIETEQTRSECAESATMTEAICRTDSDCRNKPFLPNANGRWTGRCLIANETQPLNETQIRSTGICEIQGWCPVEDDLQPSQMIREIRNFTIFVKNFIEFPMFNVKHKNMVENLRPCVFDPINNKDCPIFRLDYILGEAENDLEEQTLMLQYGGVIRIKIDWDCNLDRQLNLCKPKYSFARLDTRFREEKFSVGFNFRYASHWKLDDVYSRALKKAFGLRLIISVSGRAGKFDFITLTLNTGSLVGIFGLATFLCDIILLNLSKKAPLYRDFVFQRVHASSIAPGASQRLSEQNTRKSTVFSNPMTKSSKSTVPLASIESIDELYFTSDFPDERRKIHSMPISKVQSSLGLTNPLH